MSRLIDLVGKRFGRFVIIEQAGKNKHGQFMWLCQCDCGNKTIVLGNNLRRGHTKSCGCLRREITAERMTSHGHFKNRKMTEIYQSWAHMKDRCTNPNNPAYHNYGGRGITVCDEWMKFENFLEDMGEDWEPGLTLERRENELGYFKDNCEWVTQKENNRNKRNSLYVPYNGKNRLLVELCEEHNMPYKLVWNRIYRLGWPPEEALTTPVGKRRK